MVVVVSGREEGSWRWSSREESADEPDDKEAVQRPSNSVTPIQSPGSIKTQVNEGTDVIELS